MPRCCFLRADAMPTVLKGSLVRRVTSAVIAWRHLREDNSSLLRLLPILRAVS